ncbi:MAG TPA: hypothetical protein VNA12_06370 [Mycobacteriales bacterium]|nr:hypothetical protein [Mycobacteriales bacterium]
MTATLPRPRLTRARAVLLTALATVLAVPVVASQAQTARRCSVANRIAPVNNRWEAILKPAFDVGPQTMTAYAVQPTNPDIIYVTNGKVVKRSSDAGCSFDPVLELAPNGNGDVALSSVTTTITSITLPERGAKRRVLITAVEVQEGAGRPHVIRSESGDVDTFELGDAGLPPVGRPNDLRIAPSDPNFVLLALRAVPGLSETPVGPVPPVGGTPTQSGPVGALYRSGDGGRTWERASSGNELDGAAVIDDVAISNLNADRVWVIADGVLLSSTDRATTFTDRGLTRAQQQSGNYRFTTLDVFQQRVLAFSSTGPGGPSAVRSDNGGGTYTVSTVPFVAESAAHGARVNDVVVGTTVRDGSSDVYALSNGRWTAVTPQPNLAPFRVQIDRIRAIRFGLSPDKLYRSTADQQKPNLGDPPIAVPDDIDGLGKVRPPSMLPRSQSVSLEIGQSREITYTLQVPRRPTPLDVYIVLDNSASMTAFIDDLRENLALAVNSLRAGSVDVWAGLGYYKSLTSPPLYDRLVDVGPLNSQFFTALASLDPKKTQGNQEPILDALYQSATGEGRSEIDFAALSICDIDPSLPGCRIPPNRQANFRRDSLRVLLHAGNEEWDRNLPGSPSFDKTAAALRERNIKHVGLHVLPIARRDMQDMARATGAVAGPGGVDCSGDGRADIKAGEGLSCSGSGNLARTLVQILNGVTDVQDLRFFSRGSSPVLRSMAPVRVLPINVKADNTITFKAMVSCAGVEPGAYELRFGAALREASIAEAAALVTCGLPPAGAIAVVPAPAPPQQQAAPANPPPAPAPVPAPAPQINPATQVQGQIQAQANTGTAYEEQEQIQIATVGVDVKEREEYAMSSLPLHERSDPLTAAAAVFACGGLMAAGCGAVVLARRSRVATVRVDR